MPTERISVNTRFGLLDDERNRWGSFATSMVTNVIILILLLIIGAIHHQVVVKKMQADALLFPVEPPKPPAPIVPKVKVVAPPQPPKLQVAKIEPPKIQPPKPEIEPPKVKLDTPKPELKLPPAPPKAVAPPPAPKVGMFASNKPTPVANNQSRPQTTMGGFGDPHGVAPNPNANRAATIAAVGSFDASPGAKSGAGAARKGTVSGVAFGAGVTNGVPGGHDRGAVASAGFANGVIGGTGKPGGHGEATGASFGNGNIGASHVQLAQAAEPAFTPPVVISEPKARYTPEAQQARIQGEVTLQVRFLASGQVEVIRVVNGLGHGLDEEARHVAESIRFKPAQRNGQPVDHTTLIHVTFQLA
jgi:TonB family protein